MNCKQSGLGLTLLLLASMGARPDAPATATNAERSDASRGAPSTDLWAQDSSGRRVPLLSIEAYRAEFRWLSEHWRRLDLAGAPVRTDGWTTNIAETEWVVLGLSYLGYAVANLAQGDSGFRAQYLEALNWLVEALQTPRVSGFMGPHFGEPFAAETTNAAVFVHGHFLNLALRRREAAGDPRFDPIVHRVAHLLADSFERSSQGILPSYRDMWWLTDNFPAWSALARYDRAFGTDLARDSRRMVENIRRHYLDPKTGMFCTYVCPPEPRVRQGPRGISQMYGLHFLRDFAPQFAEGQYALAKQHLFSTVLGIPGVREFPEGTTPLPDIDSGPPVFGLGPSASGFGIAAAALAGDREMATRLARAASALGFAEYEDGRLRYRLMPPVGQSVILFGKTLLLEPAVH